MPNRPLSLRSKGSPGAQVAERLSRETAEHRRSGAGTAAAVGARARRGLHGRTVMQLGAIGCGTRRREGLERGVGLHRCSLPAPSGSADLPVGLVYSRSTVQIKVRKGWTADAAHAAAQEGERRRSDAIAQARKPAAKRACLVADATANPIHLLATRSYHRPATSITAVREAITPSSTPALSRQGIASPRPAPKLLMRIV